MSSLPGGYYIDHRVLLVARTLLAAVGAAVLAAISARQGAPASGRDRTLERLLIAIACLAVVSWTNFGALRGPNRPVALHDVFHYYIGAKYYRELGYTRIYNCVATAEMDAGRGVEVAQRWHRDLQTNELIVQAPSSEQQADCRTRFGDGWGVFRTDVEWFKNHMPPDDWGQVHTDYGFNATPTWAAITHWLAGGGPVTSRQVIALAALDYVLLAAMCVVIWRTFGPQVWCIAAFWWALSEPTSFRWLGGALLRHDALLCIVAAVCALKADRGRTAGVFLAAAVFLRAFPAIFALGLVIAFLHRGHRSGWRNAFARSRPLIVGCVAGSIAMLLFTQLTWTRAGMGATEPWRGFMAKAEKHRNTQLTNNLGLQTALSFSQSSRAAHVEQFWLDGPWDTWKAAQTSVFERRQWLYWPLVAGCVALLVLALRNTDDWVALVLGVTLLPIVANLSNYYYSVLLVFAFLWPLDRQIGLAVADLSVVTNVLPVFFSMIDDRSVIISVALVLLTIWINYRVVIADGFHRSLSNPLRTLTDVPLVGGP